MTDFSQAMTWLNKYDKSHVRPGTQIRLSLVTDETSAFDERDLAASEAVQDTDSAFDPLEKAGIARIAEYWFSAPVLIGP
jgi:hypothetical protein